MFKLVIHFWLVTLATSTSTFDSDDINKPLDSVMPVFRTSEALKKHINRTTFSWLDNYSAHAKSATEKKYPWIAKVVHSRTADVPHMCTASCIDRAIFITAARCIYNLKIKYTTVIYMSERFPVRAFVFPSNPTQQMFDDVGFIVVNSKRAKRTQWAVIELIDFPNRTDEVFKWFAKINETHPKIKYRVVGYSVDQENKYVRIPEKHFELTELNVVANMDICIKILVEYSPQKNGYGVPCYHTCTLKKFKNESRDCFYDYHGVEGGALIDTTSNKLVGISTWGPRNHEIEMPVGFATMNSVTFFKDYTCARRIRDDDRSLVTKGYYQNLCDGKI